MNIHDDRQRLALVGAVETVLVDIRYIVTWTANQSGLVTLTFWPLKWCLSHVWRGLLPLPILVFPGLSVLDLGPDIRQTKASFNAQPTRGRGITSCAEGRYNMPRPCQLTFWPWKCSSHVWRGLPLPILVFLSLSVYSRFRSDVRDRQTSDAHYRLMPPTLEAGA